MTHFGIDKNTEPKDTEIGALYAIYGHDYEGKPHFLLIGNGTDGTAFITDICDGQYSARERDRDDSALEIANSFGLIDNIRFFDDEADFDITVEF
jgi:hypothetical protein